MTWNVMASHRQLDCLFSLLMLTLKELRLEALRCLQRLRGESTSDRWCPTQRTTNAESISMSLCNVYPQDVTWSASLVGISHHDNNTWCRHKASFSKRETLTSHKVFTPRDWGLKEPIIGKFGGSFGSNRHLGKSQRTVNRGPAKSWSSALSHSISSAIWIMPI